MNEFIEFTNINVRTRISFIDWCVYFKCRYLKTDQQFRSHFHEDLIHGLANIVTNVVVMVQE